jgi:DNA-binding FadR family transcriptional regulator
MIEDDSARTDLDSPVPPMKRNARGTGRRLHGTIATKLGIAIVSGEYAPGDTLSGEVAFSEALNVSRTAYREAVQVLTAKGLVESRPKTGTKVLPKDRWNVLDPDVLAWSFANAPDIEFVRNLFELRSIIEPAAAGLAAERRERDDLRQMKEALSAMRRHTLSSDEGQSADREFHAAILRATRNGALVFLSAGIGAAVRWTTQFKQRSSGLPRNAIPDHARVYEAIAAGDVHEASEAMRVLVDLALDDTRVALNK